MKKLSRFTMVMGLFLAVCVTTIAWAAEQTAPEDSMQIVREKIQADKKQLISDNMSLTEKEAKAFWPVYESYQKELVKINDRSLKLIQFYNYAGDFGSAKVANNEANKILQDYLSIDGDRQKLKLSFLPKFSKVLPAPKVMRYYQLENKIHAVVSYELAKKIPLAK
jgi:hypothetical protein